MALCKRGYGRVSEHEPFPVAQANQVYAGSGARFGVGVVAN